MSARTFSPQERIGVNAVERLVTLEMEWLWREQFVADFGIDGQIEVVGRDRRPTGQLFAVQVKSGPSYFRGQGETVPFYVDDDHLKYWAGHALPTILVLHNPDDGTTIWQWANLTTAKAGKKGWRIDVPRAKVLGAASKEELLDQTWSDDSVGMRRRFALDRQFMEKFESTQAYVRVDRWVNKHLMYREIQISFGDPDGPPDYEIPIMATWGHDVGEILHHFLPWLSYEYYEEPDDSSSEIESNIFSVELSDAAKGFLAAERFFANPVSPEHEGDNPDDDAGDSEFDEWDDRFPDEPEGK